MIVKPTELPEAKDLRVSRALARVSGWRLDNHAAGPSLEEALAFGMKHKTTFFQRIRETLRRIDQRRGE